MSRPVLSRAERARTPSFPFRPPRFDTELAACGEANAHLFFPPTHGGGMNDEQERAAKRVCGSCPVRDACATEAILNNEEWGVWGGLTPDERAPIRAQLAERRAVNV